MTWHVAVQLDLKVVLGFLKEMVGPMAGDFIDRDDRIDRGTS